MKVFHNRQVRHRALLPPITHARYKVVQSAEMAALFSFSSRPRGQHTAGGGQANSSLLALPVSYVLSRREPAIVRQEQQQILVLL